MSLKLFSDQCVPAEISEILARAGHKVTLLRHTLPIKSPDADVIAKAQTPGAILVSLNGDFADIVDYLPSSYVGIVAIQLKNHPETIPTLMTRLIDFLNANPDQTFYHGKLIVVEPHRIRIRQ
jgi:predicted nuclease of predicted toxin-antitoxin system